jgi:hypothetical protein
LLDSVQLMLTGALVAAQHGITFATHDRLVIVVPERDDTCPTVSTGWPLGGGKGSTVIVENESAFRSRGAPACRIPRYYAHEFGHTSTFDHAGIWPFEYGDVSDNMGSPEPAWAGSALPVHYNAVRKYQLGWLAPSKVLHPGPGTTHVVELQATAADPASPHPALIVVGDHYISYRAPLDLDANLHPFYRRKVQIHQASGPVIPNVLQSKTWLQANLGAGHTRTTEGYTLDVLSAGETSARVRITTPSR